LLGCAEFFLFFFVCGVNIQSLIPLGRESKGIRVPKQCEDFFSFFSICPG
jgi:hypothetical protein